MKPKMTLTGLAAALPADAMEGKDKKVNPHAGTNKVIAGLNTYGKYFDHPNWKGL